MKVKFLNRLLFILIISHILSGCDFLSSKSNTTANNREPALLESGDLLTDSAGVTTTNIKADYDKYQLARASSESTIPTVKLSFPPNSIDIDTQITLQEGASLATAENAAALGLTNITFTSAGLTVLITSSENIESKLPLTLEIPVPAKTELLSLVEDAKLAVLYRTNILTDSSKTNLGILNKSNLKVFENSIQINITKFGMYQAVLTNEAVTANTEVASTEKTQSKTEYTASIQDADGDGVLAATDCDETNKNIYQLISGYLDTDGDGFGTGEETSVCSGASLASGYVTKPGDEFPTDDKHNTYIKTSTVGGTKADSAQAVKLDSSGNIYTVGKFTGTVDFDPGEGTDSKTSAGSFDIFLTKINADGSYNSTQIIGGTGEDIAYSLTIDNEDNVIITGSFEGTVDFDPSAGTDSKVSNGGSDIFVTKISGADGGYIWTTTIGGTANDKSQAITHDTDNDIYVTGDFKDSVDFGGGPITANGLEDIFTVKLLKADGSYVWENTLGGTLNDSSSSIVVDSTKNVYIAGYFEGTVTFGVPVTAEGGKDAFITKLSAAGAHTSSVTFGAAANATSEERANALAIDSSDNIYTTGSFENTVDFDPGAGEKNQTSLGDEDIFILKLQSDLTYLWSKSIGGIGRDNSRYIATDSSGNIYVTGYYSLTVDFDFGNTEDKHTTNGFTDIFITKINSDASYGWTKSVGGSTADVAYGLALTATNKIFTVGYYTSTVDFDFSAEADSKTSNGDTDIFILEF